MIQAVRRIPKTLQEVSVEQTLRSFLLDCSARNLSPQTTAWYERRVNYLLEFLKNENASPLPGDLPLSHLTEQNVKLFIQHHRERAHKKRDGTLSSYTVKGTVASLKVFFTYLFNEGYMRENLSLKIKTPKVCKKIIQTLSAEQIRALLSAPNKNSFAGFRNYCILLMFLDTGLRLSELAYLKADAVNLSTNTLRVLGKGNKERIVPFGMSLRKSLEKYLTWRGKLPGQDAVFVDQFGRTLKLRLVEKMVQWCGEKAGITGIRMSPHTLRHTFAKMSILNGMDAITLQYILGHTSLEMVRNYVNLTQQEITLQRNRVSLIDRMGIQEPVKKKKLW